jgi:multiple antibiotic resistance protein
MLPVLPGHIPEESFFTIYIKFFFLLTPFSILSIFLLMTEGKSETQRRKLAHKVTLATVVICALFFFAGEEALALMGLTADSFRVGAGVLLMLTAIGLAQGYGNRQEGKSDDDDIAVVPLAIPAILGPACISTILVYGIQLKGMNSRMMGFMALSLALVTLGLILRSSMTVGRVVGMRNLRILGKLSGIILAAIAAQMIFLGATNLIKSGMVTN